MLATFNPVDSKSGFVLHLPALLNKMHTVHTSLATVAVACLMLPALQWMSLLQPL